MSGGYSKYPVRSKKVQSEQSLSRFVRKGARHDASETGTKFRAIVDCQDLSIANCVHLGQIERDSYANLDVKLDEPIQRPEQLNIQVALIFPFHPQRDMAPVRRF